MSLIGIKKRVNFYTKKHVMLCMTTREQSNVSGGTLLFIIELEGTFQVATYC